MEVGTVVGVVSPKMEFGPWRIDLWARDATYDGEADERLAFPSAAQSRGSASEAGRLAAPRLALAAGASEPGMELGELGSRGSQPG
jgi:hypothetical protein